MKITITTASEKITVVAPYNAEFVSGAKRLNGRWSKPAWVFDARDADRVRALCVECYGTDGTTADLVTLRITWTRAEYAELGPIAVRGRTVARAAGRDSGAQLGDDVVILDGEFRSGGSMKNWRTVAQAGTIALVRDFPRAAAEALVADSDSDSRVYAIEPEAPAVDADALRAERERLVARIAEIDRLLA